MGMSEEESLFPHPTSRATKMGKGMMLRMADLTFTTDMIPKSYAPCDIEAGILSRWDEANLGHCEADAEGTPFSILIPPPNVTAPLHLGQALNNTLQDVLTRWHRMKGNATLWMPGTDHAGIATQTVVEKRLMQQEGKKRTDFSRADFVSRVQDWKEEYEATILGQLRSLGASCDWQRTRFTMDDVCATAVREGFFRLFKDGLIYRGKRLVNWDPVTLTALADDEVEMKEVAGHMYYLRYPLEDGEGHVTVATTRPETMLGDTAVAIHPDDPRAESLRGKHVCLPIVGRIIPIIEDDHVIMPNQGDDPKSEFATGFLKVTPAHDPNDWEIGQRHELDIINVMAPDASISNTRGWDDCNEEASQFLGMSREEARDAIVAWFRTTDLLEEIRDYEHSVGHSYRSHVPIEPYLSDQWYVKVTDDRLCNEALRALSDDQYDGKSPVRDSGGRVGDGQLRFFPRRYAHSYQAWHENLRDWCISRQLWWGHQIPVWSKSFHAQENPKCPCESNDAVTVSQETDNDGVTTVYACIAGDNDKLEQEFESAGFSRDEDVLDTWFSSALWPISTMGWPDPDAFPETSGLLDRFNPTTVLMTAREIITLWVSRMVMFSRYFREGVLPFNDVYIHPMVQDGFGQKMSKSLGNGVDPRDIISTHGADAMRYSLVQLATGTQDVRVGVDLICPYSNEVFEPTYIKSKTGHQVMAPIQDSPDDPNKKMSTLYGLLIGEVEDDENTPLARNTSPRFDVGRNFANKFWNAARFALMNITSPAEVVDCESLQAADQWMLHRVTVAVGRMNEAFETYQFNTAVEAMYDVLWRDFCDWYLEAIKPTIKENQTSQRVLHTVLDVLCRLIHPICPFVTEAMWKHIHSIPSGGVVGIELPASDLAATATWPDVSGLQLDKGAVDSFERAKELIAVIRAKRAENKVASKLTIDLMVPESIFDLMSTHKTIISSLAGVGSITLIESDSTGLAVPFEGENILLTNMKDAGQSEEGETRLKHEIEALKNQIDGFKSRLDNDSYIKNAPVEVVQETKDMLAKAEQDLATAQEALSK